MIILLSLVEEPQCHNKWKLILHMCAISLIYVADNFSESWRQTWYNKLEGKKHSQNFVILRFWHVWVSGYFFQMFSTKCWRNKFTAFFIQKSKKVTILIFGT